MYPDYHYENYDEIIDDDEHITGLIAKSPAEYVHPPIYKSKYRKSIEEEVAHGKSQHRTLGVMRVSLNTPQEYLRKNSGIHREQPKINHQHYHRPDYQHKLPTWEPLRRIKLSKNSSEILPNDSQCTMKNFKKENILNIKKYQARTSKSFTVGENRNSSNIIKSTGISSISATNLQHHAAKNSSVNIKRTGEKQLAEKNLERSSIQMTATKSNDNMKKNLNALKLNKSNIKHDEKELETILKNGRTKTTMNLKELPNGHYISDDERAELLYGMKKKWDEMMRQFQALPFLTDTPPKVKRKSKMEEDLKRLEKDIEEIERHPQIYVYDDNGAMIKKKIN